VCRFFLLRPDDDMKGLIEYSLAVAAKTYGMKVHAFCAMSTHIHVVLTDPNCRLPLFLAYFHRLVAMGTKVLRHWEGSVWDSRQPSVVELLTDAAIVEKIAYVLANPVAAGAVFDADEWPGAKTRVADMGQTVFETRRPAVYFDATNWPDVVKLPITLPPTITEDLANTFRDEVTKVLAADVAEARKNMGSRSCLGANVAATISTETRSKTREPIGEMNPTFAVGRGNGDLAKSAAKAVTAIRSAYRVALEAWRLGNRTVAFPDGTWWMRVFHSVNIGGSI
jgi:putative transposase